MKARYSGRSLAVPSLALGALLSQAAPAAAQTLAQPTLRADIELQEAAPSASATGLLAVSTDRALIRVTNFPSASTLWVTDALGLSATQVPETDQGLALTTDAASPREAIALPNGNFVVRATVAGLGSEPVVIDPSGPTATLLGDLIPGPGSSSPESLVNWMGETWFLANNGFVRALYSTDGTAAGTALRAALPAQGFATGLVATPGSLLLAVRSDPSLSFASDALYELSSPAASWTVVQSGTISAPFFGPFQAPVMLGSGLLLSLDNGSNGFEPWISDGTPQGTFALADLDPGAPSSFPSFLAELNGSALFAATEASTGTEYYLTDGTPAGTALLGDLSPGPSSGADFSSAVALGGQFLLGVDLPGTGAELWTAGTTPGSAALLVDLLPGIGGSAPLNFQVFGGQAYFGANTLTEGRELFVSDGTAQGTALVADIFAGPDSSFAEPLASLPWGVLVEATGPSGREPYVSDGTAAGTVLLENTVVDPINGSSSPADFLRFQDRVVFGAETEELGRELYQLRLGAANAELIADVVPGSSSSGARPLATLDGRFLFTANSTSVTNTVELWSSTGAPGSELKLADLQRSNTAPPAIRLGDEVLLIAPPAGQNVPSLWRTDGTVAGTTVLLDGLVNLDGPLVEFGGSAWFRANAGGTGLELWKSDGTVAGTSLVEDLTPGTIGGTGDIVPVGDWLAVSKTSGLPLTLLAFDAQGNSTQIGSFSSVGSPNFVVQQSTAFGNLLAFGAFVLSSPNQLGVFISDGTDAGTFGLEVTSPGETLGEVLGFVSAGDRAYFWTRNDGELVWNLWTTQGTQASTLLIGTYQLDNLNQFIPLSQSIVAGARLGSSDRAIYALTTVDKVTRLFVVEPIPDGLTLSAVAEADIEFDGLAGFQQALGARLGSEFLFSASDQVVGFEVHALPIVELDGYVAETFGSSCGSAQIGSQGEARVGSAFSVELDAQPLSAAGLFVAFDTNFQDLVPGCQALIGNSTLLASRVTDGAGDAQVDLTIPALPSLAGVAFYSQWAVLSAGGPVFGFVELTDGLEVILGN